MWIKDKSERNKYFARLENVFGVRGFRPHLPSAAAKINARKKARSSYFHKLLRKYKGKCYYCGLNVRVHKPEIGEQHTEDLATIDHVISLERGGINTFDNMVISCLGCNREKARLEKELFIFVTCPHCKNNHGKVEANGGALQCPSCLHWFYAPTVEESETMPKCSRCHRRWVSLCSGDLCFICTIPPL